MAENEAPSEQQKLNIIIGFGASEAAADPGFFQKVVSSSYRFPDVETVNDDSTIVELFREFFNVSYKFVDSIPDVNLSVENPVAINTLHFTQEKIDNYEDCIDAELDQRKFVLPREIPRSKPKPLEGSGRNTLRRACGPRRNPKLSNLAWDRVLKNRVSRLKLVITREVAADRRVYSRSDLVLFSVSSSLGVQLWRVTRFIDLNGDVACYSFMMNGFLQFITLLCFIELVAVQPCLGGPYHYTYNTSGRMMAFLVGWLLIGMMVLSTARIFQMASYLVDHTIFGGIISESERKYFDISFLHSAADSDASFRLTFINEYIDIIPFFLSVSFCGVVAAETNDSKIINIGVFLLSFCVLNCFILLLSGNAETSSWMKHFHVGSILRLFKEGNGMMSSVYALMYFGEEALHPSEDLPPAMLWSYFITWGWYAVFPTLLWLNGRDINFDSPRAFVEILISKGFEGVAFLPPLGITCAVYSSCFVELFVTIQLFLAMARDRLLPKVFGKVEHFNRMPVLPTFLVGVIIGLLSIFFSNSFLLDVSTSMHHILIIFGPILVLKQRYMFSIVHIEDKVERTKRPNFLAGPAVYASAFTFFMFGHSAYTPSTPYIVHPKVEVGSYIPSLVTYGCISTGAFLFLLIQPQAKPKTKYRVPFVPYVPIFAIMLYGFTFQYLTMWQVYVICGWMFIVFLLHPVLSSRVVVAAMAVTR